MVDRPSKCGTKAGKVCPSIPIGNGVGVTEDLVVIAVVVLNHYIHEHVVSLIGNDDWLRVDDLFVFAELPNELLNAIAIKECFLFVFFPVINQHDLHTGIEEGQFAQARSECVKLEILGDGENFGIRFERNQRASAFGLADYLKLTRRFAAFKFHGVHLTIAEHFHFEPFRKCIDALGAHTVEAAGIFIRTLAKLAAGMEVREHQLHSRYFKLWMNVHRNTAAVITNAR